MSTAQDLQVGVCYGCGSSEGSAVRLCPNCTVERQQHKTAYLTEQRKVFSGDQNSLAKVRPEGVGVLIAVRGLFLGLGWVVLAAVLGTVWSEWAPVKDLDLGLSVLLGIPMTPTEQVLMVMLLSMPGTILEILSLYQLWRVSIWGIFLSFAGVLFSWFYLWLTIPETASERDLYALIATAITTILGLLPLAWLKKYHTYREKLALEEFQAKAVFKEGRTERPLR